MRKPSVMLFVVCIASLFPGIVSADNLHVYKWVDSQGVLHYSDHAPTKPQQAVKLVKLRAPPPPNPQQEAQTTAWIASINKWYQSVLQQQAQQQKQEIAWENAQARLAASAYPYTQEMPYVTPLYWGSRRFGFRHRYHRPDHDDFMRPHRGNSDDTPDDTPPAFHSSIWNTQPGSFPSDTPPSSFPEEGHKP
ncbi:MAG: DUF4124 domain-containing protein [Gammaproteobacteria bacterium]